MSCSRMGGTWSTGSSRDRRHSEPVRGTQGLGESLASDCWTQGVFYNRGQKETSRKKDLIWKSPAKDLNHSKVCYLTCFQRAPLGSQQPPLFWCLCGKLRQWFLHQAPWGPHTANAKVKALQHNKSEYLSICMGLVVFLGMYLIKWLCRDWNSNQRALLSGAAEVSCLRTPGVSESHRKKEKNQQNVMTGDDRASQNSLFWQQQKFPRHLRSSLPGSYTSGSFQG